jgi:hypothetical protein
LYLPNAEMTLDLEVNEVEVKGLTSLASVTEITGYNWEAMLGDLDLGNDAKWKYRGIPGPTPLSTESRSLEVYGELVVSKHVNVH